MFLPTAFAQAAQAAQPSMLENLMPIAFIIAIFYFLMIRPQQKRAKTHETFVTALKRGDQVLTTGGIFGTVEGITDSFITLQIADEVKIRILKTQIASPASEETKK